MSWSNAQERRRIAINDMSPAELVHLMIINYDGDKESNGPYTQNFDYFWAAEALDQKWKALTKEVE